MYALSACIEWLFAENDRPFPDRIRAAADAGIPSVEFWNWRDKDVRGVRTASIETGVTINAFCVEPRGVLLDASTHEVLLLGLRESIDLAHELGTPNLIVMAGIADLSRTPADQTRTVVDGLRACADLAEKAGITVLLEPLNTSDHPGQFLSSTTEALSILRQVDSPNVKLLYDAYHSRVMGEDPRKVLDGSMPLVGHIQIADASGRHEPGTGLEDWGEHLSTFTELGYGGAIGLEYMPSVTTKESLTVITELLERNVTGR